VALPANGPLAPTVFGFSEQIKPIDYDQEEAKKLLKEAGYEDGFSATVLINDRITADLAEIAQARLVFYKEIQQIIVDEAPIVPIDHSFLLAGLRDEVLGLYQYPSSFPYLQEVSLD